MPNKSTHLIIMIASAIAINYIGSSLALFLKLPIYLDMIGTLLIAITYGSWLGMLTALASSLISAITTDIFALFFSPVALLVAGLAGYLFNRNQEHKIPSFLFKTLLVSLPGTVLASIITVLLFKGITSSGSGLIAQFLYHLGLDMTVSLVLVQTLTDYLDRLLSLGIVLASLKKHYL